MASGGSEVDVKMERVIGVIDVDSFEVQVWHKEENSGDRVPPLETMAPTVVADSGGRLLSVNHRAKVEHGITIKDREQEALQKYPLLKILRKPDDVHGKPNTKIPTKAKDAFVDSVIDFVDRHPGTILEYNGGDEVFLDFTDYLKAPHTDPQILSDLYNWYPNSYEGKNYFYESYSYCLENPHTNILTFLSCPEHEIIEKNFACLGDKNLDEVLSFTKKLTNDGVPLLDRIINHVETTAKLKCSGGVGGTKLLAKFACGLNKPGGNTVLTQPGYKKIVKRLTSIEKIPWIGDSLRGKLREKYGKDSEVIKNVIFWEDLSSLQRKFGEIEGKKIWEIFHGEYDDQVVARRCSNEVNCSKSNLRMRSHRELAIQVKSLLREMIEDKLPRELKRNSRIPLDFIITYYFRDGQEEKFSNVVYVHNTYDVETPLEHCYQHLVRKYDTRLPINPMELMKINVKARNFKILSWEEKMDFLDQFG